MAFRKTRESREPREGRRDSDRDSQDKEGGFQRSFRKKTCRFCADKTLPLDYKDARALRSFLTEREKLLPRRITGLCSYHQRRVTHAVKRARILAIIPFAVSQREGY